MKKSSITYLIPALVFLLTFFSLAAGASDPNTTITSGPSGTIASSTFTFEWSGNDDDTATSDLIYSYTLEGKDESWSNWTYSTSKTYSRIHNGNYTFKVKARDEAGNVDPTAATRSFSLESTDPGMDKWSFQTGARIYSSPAVDLAGTIYVTSRDHLYAVNPDGSEKWSFGPGDYFRYSSPAIGPDGAIYVGSDEGTLYAVTGDGTKKWSFQTGNEIDSSPAIGPQGTIYVVSGRHLYAVNPNGTEKWSFDSGDETSFSPGIGPDGSIYLVSGRNLYSINHDGIENWSLEFHTATYPNITSPAIGDDGTIYVSSAHLYAVNPDGTIKWEYDPNYSLRSSPAIAPDGTIYACSSERRIYAVKPDGTQKWVFETDDTIRYSSPAVGADGTVYIGSYDNNLYAINPDGTEKWVFETGDRVESSPTIVSDSTIYVGSTDGNLYAIYGDNGGLADTSWPMFRHDFRHTGRAADVTLPPAASFSYTPSRPIPGTTITFDASSSSSREGSIEEYSWDWDYDGTYDETTSQATIDHSFASQGDYPVTLKVTDTNGIYDTLTKVVTVYQEDNTPPDPDPMTWESEPTLTGTGRIEMEATEATDPEGSGTEYFFSETVGNPGGNDSGWQEGIFYADSGLEVGKEYCYRVKARDKSYNNNETGWSDEVCIRVPEEGCCPLGPLWNLVSLPLEPEDPGPLSAFDGVRTPLYLFEYVGDDLWDSVASETLTQVSSLGGYFLWLPSDTPVTEFCTHGTTLTGPQEIDLGGAGWQMFGVPYEVQWGDDGTVYLSDGTETKNLPAAVNAGWIYNNIWEYNPETQAYESYTPAENETLERCRGYWMLTEKDDLTLHFSESGNPPTPDTSIPSSAIYKSNRHEGDVRPPLPAMLLDHANANSLDIDVVSRPDEVAFHVKGKNLLNIDKVTVEVLDVSGTRVARIESGESVLNWDTTEVPNGVYLYSATIQLEGNLNQVNIGKFLVLK